MRSNPPRAAMFLNAAMFLAALLAPMQAPVGAARAQEGVTRYVRFEAGDRVAYGMLEEETIHELSGDFGRWEKAGATHRLADVKLLVPCEPTQVIALAGNYKSHIAGAPLPARFEIPQPFFKSLSSLAADGEPIVIPPGTEDVHYEAELVIVIGRLARNVPEQEALDYVLGVTCGNDVSARDWQDNDVQWWRAKGSDTFGPCGPVIASGLDYGDLLLTLRLNGEVKQEQRTSDLIHSVPAVVSFISRHITLHPGDLIYTGTPGETSAIQPGDVVEVELEGVGVLRNGVEKEEEEG